MGKLFSVVFERTVTSAKVSHFAIINIQITHRGRIADKLQPQFVRYLRMEEEPIEEAASVALSVAASGVRVEQEDAPTNDLGAVSVLKYLWGLSISALKHFFSL